MDLRDAKRLALKHMGEHVPGWNFGWDNAKTRYGQTRYDDRVITLSRSLTRLCPREDVEDTVLHEVAHALAGPKAGHGPVWRAHARRIGARPNRCARPGAPRIAGQYRGTCLACGGFVTRHRLTQRTRDHAGCSKCIDRNGGRWDDKYKLVWTRHAPSPF